MVKSALIECIPNLSEGRDLDRLESLATTLSAIPDLQLLQSHCDADHHRSVWTLAGSPHALEQAIDHLYQFAHQHIDLRHHQGAHPRIGALDLVPFVPLRGITRAETVLWADALAQKMATQWHLPIYLYEYSARSDHRRSLPTLRQGGTTGLEKRLQTDPNWLPDYGPSHLHPQLGSSAPLDCLEYPVGKRRSGLGTGLCQNFAGEQWGDSRFKGNRSGLAFSGLCTGFHEPRQLPQCFLF
jgi:glutamate formiminotransferase